MRSRRKLGLGLATALASVLAALAVAELVFRLEEGRLGVRSSELWELRGFVCHGQSRFLPKAYVGWVFDPGHPGVNASGFLGPDFPLEKRPGVLRIACLGGSTTAGNLYQGYENSYPGCLAQVLSERLGRPVEVMNFGVSGWTSAESLVNYFLDVQDYRPDVVVLHDAVNDVRPRLWSPFRSDYTHYSHPWQAPHFSFLRRFLTRWSDLFAAWELPSTKLELVNLVSVSRAELLRVSGAPLRPETARAFRRNVATMAADVQQEGGIPVLLTLCWNRAYGGDRLEEQQALGLQEHNEILRQLAAAERWPLFDLAVIGEPTLAGAYVDQVHLTPAGNRRKAELVADFLIEQRLVETR